MQRFWRNELRDQHSLVGISLLKISEQIYVGFCVLDMSKLHMYNHMKMRYPEDDQLELLFTYTNSPTYAIKTDYIYTDMLDDIHLFDFSGYQDDHPCFAGMAPIYQAAE